MKKIVLSLLSLAVCSAMVFAEGSQQKSGAGDAAAPAAAPAGPVTIRWAYWGGETRIKISQQAIDLFMAANKDIVVNPEPSGGTGDHFNKVDTQIAGGSGPDIIQMGGNIFDYVKRGVLLPLDSYAGTVLDTKAIDPGAISSGSYEGALYGVSTGVNMPCLVYNKTMIEKAGVPLPKTSMTYDEFRAYLMSLKGKLPAGVYPMQDIGALSGASFPFGYWTRYNGTPLYDDKTNSTAVTANDAQKYLEIFVDYRKNGLIPPADVAAGFAETNADTASIIAGKVAISVLWTNQLKGYQGATKDELALIEFPGAAATKALWPQPSQFYTVNKASKNPEAAVKFINFIVNSPEAAKVLGNDRGTSASATARTAVLTDINDQKVLEYLRVAGPHSSPETPHLPNDTELNSTLYLIYQKVAFGQINPAEGGQQIYDLIIRLINKK